MSRWNACRALLDAHFLTLAGLDPNVIAWPNRRFTKPTTGMFFKVDYLPESVASAVGTDGATHETGTYQVSIFTPAIDARGIVPGMEAVDSIVAHFDRKNLTGSGLSLQCSVPIPAPMLQETDWVQWPVSIRFIAL